MLLYRLLYISTYYITVVIITIAGMLLPLPMDYGPMKVKYLTHESCCSGFDFPFIKYIGHGGAPHLRIYFLEQHDGVFLGDMVYLQQSYPPNSTIHGSKSSLSMGKGPRAACCSVYYSVHHIDRLRLSWAVTTCFCKLWT